MAKKILKRGEHEDLFQEFTGRHFQLKSVWSYSELEWKQLITNGQTSEAPESPPVTPPPPKPKQLTVKCPEPAKSVGKKDPPHLPVVSGSKPLLIVPVAPPPSKAKQVAIKFPEPAKRDPPRFPIIPKPLPLVPGTGIRPETPEAAAMREDFAWIHERILYSPQNLNKIRSLDDAVRYTALMAGYKSVELQDHYLCLRSKDPRFSFFVYPSSGEESYERNLNLAEEMRTELSKFGLVRQRINQHCCGSVFCHVCKISANILFRRSHLLQAQICRLIPYLCKFDHRLRQVLVLVTFWEISHGIKLAVDSSTSHFCPDPLPLHLMVVLFFMTKGLLPSRERLERDKHSPLLLTGREHKLDVSFWENEKFLKEWKAAHPCPPERSEFWRTSIVQLTLQMFQFYSSERLGKGRWLWSVYDGVVLSEEQVQEESSIGGSWPIGEPNLDERVFLTHPFNRSWQSKISISVKALDGVVTQKMKEAAENLEKYIAGGNLTLAECLALGKNFQKVQDNVNKCDLQMFAIPK